MQFLTKIADPEVYSGWSRASKMKLFEKKIFSCSPFTQEAPSYVFDSVLNTPLELLTIFAIGSILMFDWVLDTLLTCLKTKTLKNLERSYF